jgi:hypothetical protein
MHTLCERGWDDSETLLNMAPKDLVVKFATDSLVLKESKQNLHVAPQHAKISNYEPSYDFMDYVLTQTNPEQPTPSEGMAMEHHTVEHSAEDMTHSTFFLPPTSSQTLRDQLKTTIAGDHVVYPQRVAIGHQWADPGCYNVGDDTMVNALIDLRDSAYPAYYETPEQEDMKRHLLRERIQNNWTERVIPQWDRANNKFTTAHVIAKRLDELEVAQHNMLMKRALKLLSKQHYGIMIKRLSSFLSMSRKPGDKGINKLYEELQFLFGLHFNVMRPLFDSLLPMICVATLQDQGELTLPKLGNDVPTLIALGGWSELHRDFHHFLTCHAQLNTRSIQPRHVKRAAFGKTTINAGMWKRIRRTMLTEGNMSRNEFDEVIRDVLRKEKTERENLRLIAGSAVEYNDIGNNEDLYGMSHVDDAMEERGEEEELEEEEEEEEEEDEDEEDFVHSNSLTARTLVIVNLPPYVTEKDVKKALPASEHIARVDVHGDNMKNTLRTIKVTTKSHFNKKKMSAAREKVLEVINSQAFALVEYDTVEHRNKARHRYLEYFGAKVHTKFKDRVEKDPTNGELYAVLKR